MANQFGVGKPKERTLPAKSSMKTTMPNYNFPSSRKLSLEEFGSLKDYKPVYYMQKFECGHSEEKLLNPLCAEHYPTNPKWKEWVLIIGGSLIAGPIIYYFAGIVLAITNGQ